MLIFGETDWGNLVVRLDVQEWGKFYVNIGRNELG